jgi:tetratricopeptide (TPR) repeat protein
LAGALLATGKEDEGIKHLENAVKMNPKYVDAYFNLGAIYYDRGLYSKSVENYRKVYLFRPNDDKAVYGFAAAEYALGEFDLSLEDCKKALTLNPKNENAKVLFDMLQHRSK